MTSTYTGRIFCRGQLFAFLRHFYAALIVRRQAQADQRVALYLRGLPDETRDRLGVSGALINTLRRRRDANESGASARGDQQ